MARKCNPYTQTSVAGVAAACTAAAGLTVLAAPAEPGAESAGTAVRK
jgi:hypothetical protein